MWGATVASLLLWDDEGWERLSSLHAKIVRDTGALSDLAISLSHQGQLHVFAGELELAASAQEALLEASDLTQSPLAPYHSAALVAMRGRENEAAQLIEASRAEVTARGEGAGIAFMDWAESLLYNGLGRYEEALRAARNVFANSQLVELNWALPELIEAAARVGDLDIAIEADRVLSERTGASGTDWALGVAARSHALVTNDADADRLYREAIECLERTRMAVDLARSHLLYGEWLRREQRRRDAREHLRIAHERFLEFGMEAFAQRAALELRATGAKSRARTEETRLNLTPQELRISELAGHGATNKEIAAQMFISAATVEYHLHKVFRKLDVKTRTQLAQRLVQLSSRENGS
jgi:DNA-binding CsgD family transcriptional regulator